MAQEVPVVVSEAELLNQTQNPNAFTNILVYTPPVNTQLLIMAQVSVPSSTPGPLSFFVTALTTNVFGTTETYATSTSINAGAPDATLMVYVNVQGGIPITVQIQNSTSGTNPPITYNAFVTILDL